MKTLKRVFFTLIALCWLSTSYSQSVRLVVYDHSTSLAISKAAVTVSPNELKDVTNTEGWLNLILTKGKYTFKVSHVAYLTKQFSMNINVDTIIKILLVPQSIKLDSVTISTGYQTLPKERATGSFTTINREKFNEQIGTNIVERLPYIANGVAPVSERISSLGENAMLIRGMSTLTATIQRPLFIVDGFEYQGDLSNVNPNDIEDITFLKDAAAASIWGAKAANGVIVMRTKKGLLNKVPQMNFTYNLSHFNRPNLYYAQPITSADLISVETELFRNKYRFADTARSTKPPFSEVYELLFAKNKGKITETELNSALTDLAKRDIRNEYLQHFYQNAKNHQIAFNITGGGASNTWYLSAGRDQNESNLAAQYYRNTFRVTNQLQILKALKIDINLAYTKHKTTSGRPGYGSIRTTNGAAPVYITFADEEGNPKPLYAYHRQGYIDTLGASKVFDWRYYPLTDYRHNTTEINGSDFNANLGMEVKIYPWLNVNTIYRMQTHNIMQKELKTMGSYYTRNLVNTFTQIAPNGNITYRIPLGSILDTDANDMISHNFRTQINAEGTRGNFHLVGLLGTEIGNKITNGTSNNYYGYNSDLLVATPIDPVNQYPMLTGGNTTIPHVIGFKGLVNRFVSSYANGSIAYLNKYTLSASARRDASNLFGQATNDRWKPLWSVGAMWNILQENWIKWPDLSDLKFRATYGKQGNIDPTKVAVTTLSYGASNPFTQTPYSTINNYPNPNLRWEEVAMYNIGIEGTLWGKFKTTIEYYGKRMKDLYANVQIDRTTGISSGTMLRNVGAAKGTGLDIELSYKENMGEIKFNSELIINTYTDKITKLDLGVMPANQLVSANFGILQDYPIFSIFAYKWAGLDPTNGDPMGYSNGTLSKDYDAILNQSTLSQAKFMGAQIPKWFGSWAWAFAWKNISLTGRLTYKFDYYFKRNSISYASLIGQLNGHADYAKRWQNSGDELSTNVPSWVYPMNALRDSFYNNAEILYAKGDHVRLQYVNLNYTMDKKSHQWLPLNRINLTLAANDLPIIWRANKFKLDPDASNIPRVSRWSFGLSANM